jgi:hypothetical protein
MERSTSLRMGSYIQQKRGSIWRETEWRANEMQSLWIKPFLKLSPPPKFSVTCSRVFPLLVNPGPPKDCYINTPAEK